MALSDDLAKLAARAKEAEDRFAAAQRDAHAKVQDDVKTARASLDKHTDQLRQTAEANRGKARAMVERRTEELGRTDCLDSARRRLEEGRARRQDGATQGGLR